MPEFFNEMDDSFIMGKIDSLMNRIDQNKKLQELSEKQGLDVKNTFNLTDEATKNYTVAAVSLLMAQQNRDPNYVALTKVGMNHREMRTELINKYKDSAIQMINRYNDSKKG